MMKNDYARVAVATPVVSPADVSANLAAVTSLFDRACDEGADAVVFPELCLTGCTCGDLFFHPSLLAASEDALREFAAHSAGRLGTLAVVGLPFRTAGRMFNCAALVRSGSLLALVPKSFPSSSRDGGDARWFASALDVAECEVECAGFRVPFGARIVVDAPEASYGVEVGADSASAVSPSVGLALSGATVILNPCAKPSLAGGAEYSRALVAAQSAKCVAAYVSANAGFGESTTDFVFAGGGVVAENGAVVAEAERFRREGVVTVADVDVGFLEFERSSNASFRRGAAADARHVAVTGGAERRVAKGASPRRPVDPRPFVPVSKDERDARCAEVLAIQAAGLATRLARVGCRDVVVGLSGGLDSALALLVCVEAFGSLGLDRRGIHVYTLPGFGTSSRTRGNAGLLCDGLGIEMETADITGLVRLHLKDLGRDETEKDVTYENAQARGRTYFLMDKANQLGALLVGTGDLSELALGWCTYNGDHMSMYCVNAGVPKTLIRAIVGWYAEGHPEVRDALVGILETPVSPELLPAASDGSIAQITEDRVGPYELHDFFLYHFVRRGAGREKIRALAETAFGGVYDPETISKWLDVFFRRFMTQQFKRSCMPDGPKTGTVGLSPRGDWQMPSDAGRVAF